VNQPSQRSRTRRRKSSQGRRGAPDIWRNHAPLPEVEPIAPPHDVLATMRSLGDPPVHGGAAATNHFEVVVERAAAVALALAFSADLLAGDA
jgi:hypothetical protein